jgi:cell division protein FtsB
LRDAEEEKQLAGKKGAAVMKDLQRQLAAERKRAEKLQDRIRDLLNEGTRVNTGSSLRIQFTTEMGEIFSKS